MSVMLYKYPSECISCDVGYGFVEVDHKIFDYIVVNEDEVEACVSDGWSKKAEIKEPEKDEKDEKEISLESLSGLTAEEIKETFVVPELKAIAKAEGIRGYGNMRENNLIKRLMEKI